MLAYELPPLEDPAQLERAFVSFNIVRQTGTVNADLWAIGITTGSTRLAEHLDANSDVALTNRADNIKAQDNIIKSGNHLSRTFSDENAAGLLAGYLRKPILSGTTPLLKTGSGTLVVDRASTQRGSFSMGGGRLQIAGGSALGASRLIPLAGGTVTLSQGLQATVGGLAALAGGLTDLGDGAMTIAAGLGRDDMLLALRAGLGDGSWMGTSGITSSVAATSGGSRTVGWLDNGDGSVTVAFAAARDTNLDG